MLFTKQDKREALPQGAIITLHAPDCDDVAQFQILSEVGRGGFAIIYLAKQLGVGERYVALKELLLSEVTVLTAALATFQSEEFHVLAFPVQ
jgi:hypothetical protein